MGLDGLLAFKQPAFVHTRTFHADYYNELSATLRDLSGRPWKLDLNNAYYTLTNATIFYVIIFHLVPNARNKVFQVLQTFVASLLSVGVLWHLYDEQFDDSLALQTGGLLVLVGMLDEALQGGKKLFWSHTVFVAVLFFLHCFVDNHDPHGELFHLRHWIGHTLEVAMVVIVARLAKRNKLTRDKLDEEHRQVKRN
jgi:hypothetical protein